MLTDDDREAFAQHARKIIEDFLTRADDDALIRVGGDILVNKL